MKHWLENYEPSPLKKNKTDKTAIEVLGLEDLMPFATVGFVQ